MMNNVKFIQFKLKLCLNNKYDRRVAIPRIYILTFFHNREINFTFKVYDLFNYESIMFSVYIFSPEKDIDKLVTQGNY